MGEEKADAAGTHFCMPVALFFYCLCRRWIVSRCGEVSQVQAGWMGISSK